jgi:hypothetical protein
MTTQLRGVITKLLISAAIALGSSVGTAAAASADPNRFGGLSCGCQETAPAGSPAQREEEIERGIRAGLSAWLPGPPAPTQPRQPQP